MLKRLEKKTTIIMALVFVLLCTIQIPFLSYAETTNLDNLVGRWENCSAYKSNR